MSIATEITRLQNAKATLKTKLNAKNDSEHQIDDETLDEFGDFVDSIQTGGSAPTKGVIFSDWDSNGYPTTATVVGMEDVPQHYFYDQYINRTYFYSYLSNIIFSSGTITLGERCVINHARLLSVTLADTITTIGTYAFGGCTNMVLTKLPSSLTTLSVGSFYKCNKLAISEIPDGVTVLPNNCFDSCYDIKKVSMNNVTTIGGTTSSNMSFSGDFRIKQVWIGSAITNAGLPQYAFFLSAIEKIYIDLPRATVEGFTHYQYGFANDVNKQNIVICNDDPDFIDKATFDAQVIT